jgi:hypothetical protein
MEKAVTSIAPNNQSFDGMLSAIRHTNAPKAVMHAMAPMAEIQIRLLVMR